MLPVSDILKSPSVDKLGIKWAAAAGSVLHIFVVFWQAYINLLNGSIVSLNWYCSTYFSKKQVKF